MKRKLLSLLAALCVVGAMAETRIVAHRGYWRAANDAQNSIEAFNRADSIGVYGSEFDVWYTADGIPVIDHDRVFRGVDMYTAPIDSILAITLANGENLPTLADYLANAVTHPATRLVLEIKPLPDMVREDEAVERILAMLGEYGLADRTDIISFSLNACLEVVKHAPGIPVYYLDGDLSPRKLKALGLAGLDYHFSVIDAHPEWIGQAHDLGLKVNVWTVDDSAMIARYRTLGVDFITTNNPEEL